MCMGKMEDTKVTNVLKLVHGWQNDGQQKDLFYENNEENMCPASCGECDSRLHHIQCKAPNMDKANNDRCKLTRVVHFITILSSCSSSKLGSVFMIEPSVALSLVRKMALELC